MPAHIVKGNKCEVPPDMPIGFWRDKIDEYVADPATLEMPWYFPELELLRPRRMKAVKAKARIWYEVTGYYPTHVNQFWEYRVARREGELPLRNDIALATIEGDILTCGECGARYERHDDGTFEFRKYKGRCNRCFVVVVWSEENDD